MGGRKSLSDACLGQRQVLVPVEAKKLEVGTNPRTGGRHPKNWFFSSGILCNAQPFESKKPSPSGPAHGHRPKNRSQPSGQHGRPPITSRPHVRSKLRGWIGQDAVSESKEESRAQRPTRPAGVTHALRSECRALWNFVDATLQSLRTLWGNRKTLEGQVHLNASTSKALQPGAVVEVTFDGLALGVEIQDLPVRLSLPC